MPAIAFRSGLIVGAFLGALNGPKAHESSPGFTPETGLKTALKKTPQDPSKTPFRVVLGVRNREIS